MRIEKEPTQKITQQGNLDFGSEEEKKKSLIQNIQKKRFTSEKLTPEEKVLVRVLIEEERQDDQYRH